MTNLRNEFTKWLKSRIGDIYVWGGQGETNITEAWIRKMETDESNAKRAIAFWQTRLGQGAQLLHAYDCSGLIVEFLLDHNIVHSDMSSRGLFAICSKIDRAELLPGDLVFRHNGAKIYHVGAFVGDNMVVHARGRDRGVVLEHLDENGSGYWNRFGRLDNMPIDDADPEEPASDLPKLMMYAGSSYVNLRSIPNTKISDNVIGRIRKNDKVILLATTPTNDNEWGEVLARDGNSILRGYCVTRWLKEVVGEVF